MRKISINRMSPGVVLARDIYAYDGRLLLARGTRLEEWHLEVFRKQGLDYVYVVEDTPPGRRPARPFEDVYSESLTAMKTFMLEAKLGKPLEKTEVDKTVNILLAQVFDEVDILKQMRRMKDKDDYLFTHSINVSLLCILLGRWLKYPEPMIRNLGTAGLLHDLGKVSIPSSILTKPGKLTDVEFEQVKKHSTRGYDMLRSMGCDNPDILDGVLLHHERLDGSGYPSGLKGEEIPLFPRVIAVADVYDAVTSERTYKAKESPYKAAEILWQESFGKLDPVVAKVFYDRVSSFYVGNRVRLNTGEEGKVVYINPSLPTRPVVQVGDRFYDLSRDRSVGIVEVVD